MQTEAEKQEHTFVSSQPERFNYTDFPPFQAYGVEGWWLDNLLKAGKLSRKTYLRLAAEVTVGFQKRLADCRAAERFLHEQALQDAIAAADTLRRVARGLGLKDYLEAQGTYNSIVIVLISSL